jgi:hypothetical protein
MSLENFIKKHNIDFTVNEKIEAISASEILNAYENNNLLVLQALSKSPNFAQQFFTGLEVHFFSNEKFLTQSYELAQFTVKKMDEIQYCPKKMKMAIMVLQNKDKRSKCFLFEKYLLNESVSFTDKEISFLSNNIFDRNTWEFNFELFSLNKNFDNQIKSSSLNRLIFQLANKKDIFHKTKYLIAEKNCQWSDTTIEFKHDLNYFLTGEKKLNDDKYLQALKVATVLPNFIKIPNIVGILEEQINLHPLNEKTKKECDTIIINLEKQLLSQQINDNLSQGKSNKIKI